MNILKDNFVLAFMSGMSKDYEFEGDEMGIFWRIKDSFYAILKMKIGPAGIRTTDSLVMGRAL